VFWPARGSVVVTARRWANGSVTVAQARNGSALLFHCSIVSSIMVLVSLRFTRAHPVQVIPYSPLYATSRQANNIIGRAGVRCTYPCSLSFHRVLAVADLDRRGPDMVRGS